MVSSFEDGAPVSKPGITVEHESGVVLLTLDRPEKLNAIDRSMKVAIEQVIRDVAADDAQRVLVITGRGRGFCSGADISGPAGSPLVSTDVETRAELLQDRWFWITGLQSLEKPVLAAVNGLCVGAGLSLALACDIRFASDQAQFNPIFARRALVPDAGASYLLPRLVGTARALQLFWRAEPIGADEALRIGLIESVVPQDQLLPSVMAFASELARGPAVAIELTKRAVYRGVRATSLRDQAEYEEYLWTYSHTAADYREGRDAFQERRSPRYSGR